MALGGESTRGPKGCKLLSRVPRPLMNKATSFMYLIRLNTGILEFRKMCLGIAGPNPNGRWLWDRHKV